MKNLSNEETKTLTSEFTYQDKKAGIIGGYFEKDFPFYYANNSFVEMLGYDNLDELLAIMKGKFINIIHPDDLDVNHFDLKNVYEGMTYETTFRMLKKDKSWIWTVEKGKLIKTEDGRLAMLSICSDMSRFLRHHVDLEEKNTSSNYMFKYLPGGYHRCAVDEGNTIIYASERFLSLLGWSEEELKIKFDNKFMNLIHPDDKKIGNEFVMRISDKDLNNPYQDATYRLLCKDGYHWFSDTTMKVNINGQSFFQGIITDIDPFVLEKQQKLNIFSALGNVYEEIAQVDLNTNNFVIVGGLFEGKSGKKDFLKNVLVSQNIDTEFREKAEDFFNFDTVVKRLEKKNMVGCDLKATSGRWFSFSIIAQKRDEKGDAIQVLLTARNVTEQKEKELEYQEKLKESIKAANLANKAKMNFLRRMSHDIRTPLNGIIGLLKIDEYHFDDIDLVKENHQKMENAANHLLALINDILQTSKLEDGKERLTHEFIDIRELTKGIVNIIYNRAIDHGLKWEYDMGDNPSPYPYIYGSPLHLRQIFLNIYGNCIKYNKPNGKIKTKVEVFSKDNKKCTYRWTISDTGIGMSQDFLKHIYEPFKQEYSDKSGSIHGVGLGMSIVKGLIDQMGGTIEIHSEINVGSTFIITIPFDIAHVSQIKEDKSSSIDYNIENLNILLVEDNALNAEIAKTLLEEQGAFVSIAVNGKIAVDMFNSHHPHTYDLILMDMMMPVMDGIEATKQIRSLERLDAREIPIIAMTANAFNEDKENCLKAGMNEFIPKPLDIKTVKKTIYKCSKKDGCYGKRTLNKK